MRKGFLQAIVVAVSLAAAGSLLWGMWWFIHPQMWLLHRLHRLLGGWGPAILLAGALSTLVGLTFVLATAGSDRRMKAIKPELDDIKRRHADDEHRKNVELMYAYRRIGITGWGQALRVSQSMIVLWFGFAFYLAVWRMPDLDGASFLWIPDLSRRDPRYLLPLIDLALLGLAELLRPRNPQTPRQNSDVWVVVVGCVISCFLPASINLLSYPGMVKNAAAKLLARRPTAPSPV